MTEQAKEIPSPKKPLPTPKWRRKKHIIFYGIIASSLIILGLHGLFTKETIMIFGNQEDPNHYYSFAIAYLILGVLGIFAILTDLKSFKSYEAKGFFSTEPNES